MRPRQLDSGQLLRVAPPGEGAFHASFMRNLGNGLVEVMPKGSARRGYEPMLVGWDTVSVVELSDNGNGAPKPRGRPRLPDDEKRDYTLNVRLSEEEHARVHQAAKRAEIPVSKWTRRVLLKAARAHARAGQSPN